MLIDIKLGAVQDETTGAVINFENHKVESQPRFSNYEGCSSSFSSGHKIKTHSSIFKLLAKFFTIKSDQLAD